MLETAAAKAGVPLRTRAGATTTSDSESSQKDVASSDVLLEALAALTVKPPAADAAAKAGAAAVHAEDKGCGDGKDGQHHMVHSDEEAAVATLEQLMALEDWKDLD